MDRKTLDIIGEVIFNRDERVKEEQAGAHVWNYEYSELPNHEKIRYRLRAEEYLEVNEALRIKKEIILEDRLRKYCGYPPYGPEGPLVGDKDYLKDIHSKHTEASITRTFLMISNNPEDWLR